MTINSAKKYVSHKEVNAFQIEDIEHVFSEDAYYIVSGLGDKIRVSSGTFAMFKLKIGDYCIVGDNDRFGFNFRADEFEAEYKLA